MSNRARTRKTKKSDREYTRNESKNSWYGKDVRGGDPYDDGSYYSRAADIPTYSTRSTDGASWYGYPRGRGGASREGKPPREYENDRERSSRGGRSQQNGKTVSDSGLSSQTWSQRSAAARTSEHRDVKFDSRQFGNSTQLSGWVTAIYSNEDREQRIAGGKQLLEYVTDQNNAKTVSRSADALFEALYGIFSERAPRELKSDVVRCLASVGYIVVQESPTRFMLWILSKLAESSSDEVKICLFESVLQALKKDESTRHMEDIIQMLLSNCQTVLENADQPDMLTAVVDILAYVGHVYVSAFASHFMDTVDILVGWFIDPSQSERVTQYTRDVLVGFQQYWVNDLNFTTTLLGQFLEDMDAYTEDFILGTSKTKTLTLDEEVPPPEDCVVKITSLFKIFSTVLQSLGDDFVSKRLVGTLTAEYILENVEKMVKSVTTVDADISREALLTTSNECLALLLDGLVMPASRAGDPLHPVVTSLMSLVTRQLLAESIPSNVRAHHLLVLLKKVLEVSSVQVPVSVVSQLLSHASLLMKLRFSHDKQLLHDVVDVTAVIMSVKSVPLMEEAYRHILGDLEVSLKTLLGAGKGSDRPSVTLVTSNPYTDTYTVQEALVTAVFDLTVIAELGNNKSNLIVMWALTPSIFTLLSQHVLPVCLKMVDAYPVMVFAALQTLHSHCTRHSHFISSSSLLVQLPTIDTGLGAPTRGHFSAIVSLLTDLLSGTALPRDSRSMALRWAGDIIDHLSTVQVLFACAPVTHLLAALVSLGEQCVEGEVVVQVVDLLRTYVTVCKSPDHQILLRCVSVSVARLADTNAAVRSACLALLPLLPLDLLIKHGSHVFGGRSVSGPVETLHAAQHSMQSKLSQASLNNVGFKHLMTYLLFGVNTGGGIAREWLARLYHGARRQDKTENDGELSAKHALMNGSEALLWFWVSGEAAQLCVSNKLRTPLGKPQETFTSIETALRKYAQVVREKDEAAYVRSAADTPATLSPALDSSAKLSSIGGHVEALLPVGGLLMFMEQLEKALYNACEGTAVAMVTPQSPVRLFFRTNRATCQEWYNRIRVVLMTVARHAGQPAVVLRHASELITALRRDSASQASGDLETAVRYAVEALVQLQCPEAVTGFYQWYKDVTGRRLPWVKAMAEMAAGRYESAVTDLQAAMRSVISGESNAQEEMGSGGKEKTPLPPGPQSAPGSVKVMSRQAIAPSTASKLSHDGATLHLIVNQVTEAYLRLHSWQEVVEWEANVYKLRSEVTDLGLQKALYFDVDMNQFRALTTFQSDGVIGLIMETKCDLSAWGWRQLKDTCDRELVTACSLATGSRDSDAFVKHVNNSTSGAQNFLTMNAIGLKDSQSNELLLQLFASQAVKDCAQQKNLLGKLMVTDRDGGWSGVTEDTGVMMRALHTVNLCSSILSPEGPNPDVRTAMSAIRVETARVARKSQNVRLAERLLVDEMSLLLEAPAASQSLTEALTLVQGRADLSACHVARLEREIAKLLHSKGVSHADASLVTLLGHCVRTVTFVKDLQGQVQTSPRVTVTRDALRAMGGRSLVSVVKWLQADSKRLAGLVNEMENNVAGDCDTPSQTATLLTWLIDKQQDAMMRASADYRMPADDLVANLDLVAGRLLHLTTTIAPELPKGWCTFAGWCYKWGRKAVEVAVQGGIELTEEEKGRVAAILSNQCSEAELSAVNQCVSQLHSGAGLDDDVADQDQSMYDDGSEACRRQLTQCVPWLGVTGDRQLEQLIGVWRDVVSRVYHCYGMSARAYFTYLKLTGQSSDSLSHMDGNVNATLRLLRLMVKHAWELRAVLEEGLANTPTLPWKGIIPQLFSRLNHPETYVRRSIQELLCRVAQDSPHLIVYPAIVGGSSVTHASTDSSQDGLLNQCLSEKETGDDVTDAAPAAESSQPDDSESTALEDINTTMLQNCFLSIVDTLSRADSRMIAEVQQLVSELQRVTLLWDELWLGALSQVSQDVGRRLTQLDNEVKKVRANASLSHDERIQVIEEKMRIILKPTLHTLEQVAEVSRQPAETSHEVWFQQTYGTLIDSALAALRTPQHSSSVHSLWQPFKQLQQLLQQRAMKRQSHVLSLPDISRRLAAFKGTTIAMPGVSTSAQTVTIESIANVVQILPTKTKPKKLIFIGSDGKKYPYLFKGLEDLHLDERIMQFLSIVNNMFVKVNRGDSRLYYARHYSVTPLGARSGLIQWVDGATAIFALYKRWQQREAAAQLSKQGTPATANNQPINVPRPSEVYFGKLQPLLKEKGISNMDKRSDWPLSVQCRALEELIKETPGDLLAKELWCSSTSADRWWAVTQSYACSTAVMSMIGYIIGLGDRHLDNILVDLTKGEVIHIDYNVCFDKGRSLRVPEKVPFRMTQNIENALGVTGVEGLFRQTCELVLKVMRKGRETLLTLLEAFVYDPLVDWTISNEGGYVSALSKDVATATQKAQRKRRLELDISLGMFAIRVAEMKTDWLANRDDLVTALVAARDVLMSHAADIDELKVKELSVDVMHEMVVYLEQAAHQHQHPAHSLAARLATFMPLKQTRAELAVVVQEKMHECHVWQHAHQVAWTNLQEHKLQQACVDVVQVVYNSVGVPLSTALHDFLHGAGQQQLVQQFQAVNEELTAALHQQCALINMCVRALFNYTTVVSHFTSSYLDSNRSALWYLRLSHLAEDFTAARCVDVKQQHDMSQATSPAEKHAVLVSGARLQDIHTDSSQRMMMVLNRRGAEVADIATVNAMLADAVTAINASLTGESVTGARAMTSMLVSTLATLTLRYDIMERSALEAGDQLSELTSREGDWFLDELLSMMANICHLLHIISPVTLVNVDSELKSRAYIMSQATCKVYQALQELKTNFVTIILPEAAKLMQSGDASMVHTIVSLSAVTSLCQCPLDTLIVTLQHASQDTWPSQLLADMRSQFDLLVSESSDVELSAGNMLLMAFNGLFEQVDSDFTQVAAAQGTPVQRYVSDIFFIKRLKAMQDFFELLHQSSVSVQQGNVGSLPLDDGQLCQPIRIYIADYIVKHLIGLPTQPIKSLISHWSRGGGMTVEEGQSAEEQVKVVVDSEVMAGVYDISELASAGQLVANMEALWQRMDIIRRLEATMIVAKASQQRAQLQLVRYQWLHDATLHDMGLTAQLVQPSLATVMADIRTAVLAMGSQESVIADIQERNVQLQASIGQRLKWAAGANPQVAVLLQQFEDSAASHKVIIQAESSFVHDVVTVANSISHLEALRTRSPEGHAVDNAMVSLVDRCMEACIQWEQYGAAALSEMEQQLALVCALSPEHMTDVSWVDMALTKVHQTIGDMRVTAASHQSAVAATKEVLKGHVSHMRVLLTQHEHLMADVKPVLKALMKQEDQVHQRLCGGVRSYIDQYRHCIDFVSTLLRRLANEDRLDRDIVTDVDMAISLVTSSYDNLVSMAPRLGAQSDDSQSKSVTVSEDNASKISKTTSATSVSANHKLDKVPRDPRTGKVVQERNSYAVGVWRQVKAKLDGRDPDLNRRFTIPEQVDYVVREARSVENLAVLYEGWTSWV